MQKEEDGEQYEPEETREWEEIPEIPFPTET